jgi:AcrR family transcriptional regulator
MRGKRDPARCGVRCWQKFACNNLKIALFGSNGYDPRHVARTSLIGRTGASFDSIPSRRYTFRMSKESKRTFLLKAANVIVKRDGAENLTLDALARETGLSKGGVLYHFPTKEALLKSMLENWIEGFESSINEALKVTHPGGGAWLRAFISASAAEENTPQSNSLSLLAAIANNYELLASARERAEVWQKQATSDFDPALATLLRLAADGLFWAELLDMAPPTGFLRAQVLDLMLTLANEQNST